MTDLTQAIAELREMDLDDGDNWTAEELRRTAHPNDLNSIATILNAAASGELISLAELQALRAERDELLRAAHDNHEADKRAEAAEAELAATKAKMIEWQSSQHYAYIGRDGRTVLARDLEDQLEATKAKLARAEAAEAMVERMQVEMEWALPILQRHVTHPNDQCDLEEFLAALVAAAKETKP